MQCGKKQHLGVELPAKAPMIAFSGSFRSLFAWKTGEADKTLPTVQSSLSRTTTIYTDSDLSR